jgi:RNA polymerase sigma-70 factor (ECF subfamily)
MAAAQAGDRLAYDSLLREIVPYIRAIVARSCPTRDGVDEVVQDVLLCVHRVRHTYDPARPFRHWLGAIARRRSIDALRKHYRSAAVEVSAAAAGPAYEGYADPANTGFEDAPISSDRLGKAITALPALQRQALELLKLREMSLAEASRLTGRSIAALKVNVHRAVKSLQKQLQAG